VPLGQAELALLSNFTHRHAMEDQQHQQVMEDLANDFLCYRSSFDSTTGPPRRRRRQRRLLDSPLVRSPSGPLVIAHPAQKSHTHALAALWPQDGGVRKHQIDQGIGGKRIPKWGSSKSLQDGGAHKHQIDQGIGGKRISKRGSSKSLQGGNPKTPNASTGPNPTTSPNHDSLRSPFARKFLWTHKSHPDSPLAHAPRHRHVCAESASHAHSDGKVHQAAANTSEHVIPQPLPEPAKPLLHWAKRPVAPELQRANALRDLQEGLARAPSLRNNKSPAFRTFKAVAHVLIAKISMSAPRDLLRGVTNADVTMLAWEHTERRALGTRRWEGK